MSITDELREWAKGDALRAGMSLRTARDQALAIADRIDAEHEAKVSYWQGASYKDGYDEGFASADDWLADHEAAMAEHGWVKLPVDADGEVIHIGDVMENIVHPPTHREVTGVGAECFYAWEDGCGRYSQFDAPRYRHHHEPTVEDVLREMADRIYADEYEPRDRDAIVAEFAAKLRLAGDAE